MTAFLYGHVRQGRARSGESFWDEWRDHGQEHGLPTGDINRQQNGVRVQRCGWGERRDADGNDGAEARLWLVGTITTHTELMSTRALKRMHTMVTIFP